MKSFLEQNWLLVLILISQIVLFLKIVSFERSISELACIIEEVQDNISAIESESDDMLDKLDDIEEAVNDLD